MVLYGFSGAGEACTTFCFRHNDAPVFGRNFDWKSGQGAVFINKRGIKKQARLYGYGEPLTWISKYGSATFNQLGADFPYGGMNEAGLVVETMMLSDTEYPPSSDPRPEIGLFQWIQYQLDNHRHVEAVIKSDARLKIQSKVGAHFLICDTSADCAVVEFLGGRLVVHTGDTLPVKALSNSRYSESIGFWSQNQGPENDRRRSIERFIQAATMIGNYEPKADEPIDYAFSILSRVTNPSDTQWSIVYDIGNLGVYFRTKTNRKMRYFFLDSFDFSGPAPAVMIDVNGNCEGDISSKFTDGNLSYD